MESAAQRNKKGRDAAGSQWSDSRRRCLAGVRSAQSAAAKLLLLLLLLQCWCCCRRGEVEHDEGQTRPVVDLALVTATHPASVRGAFVTISAHIVVAHATPAVILVCTRRALSDQLYAILVKGDRKTAYHDGRRLSDQLPFVCSLADRLKSTMSNVGHFTPGTCPPTKCPQNLQLFVRY